MNHKSEAVPNLAVFCDFENVAIGVRDASYDTFDIDMVLERILTKGKIVVKKAYADWDRYKSAKRPLHEAAFELIEIPHVSYSGKNSADIRLVVDALDLCYTKSHIHGFVIISGDSDFSPLVSKLRENNKIVIGLGVKSSSSDLLIENCDEFIYYDDLVRSRLASRRKGDARGSRPALPAARQPEKPRERPPERPPERASERGRGGRPETPGRSPDARSGSGARQALEPRSGGDSRRGGGSRPSSEPRSLFETPAESPATSGEPGAGPDLAAEATPEGLEVRVAPESPDYPSASEAVDRPAPPEGLPAEETMAAEPASEAAPPTDAESQEAAEVKQAPARGTRSRRSSGTRKPRGSSRGAKAKDAVEPAAEAAPEVPAEASREPVSAPALESLFAFHAPAEAAAVHEPGPPEEGVDVPVSPVRDSSSDAASAPEGSSRGGRRSRDDRRNRAKPAETLGDKEEALKLVLETTEALLQDTDSDLWGSMVKQVLKRKRPNFAESYYGYRSFNELLMDAEQRGLLEMIKDPRSGGYRIVGLGPNT